MLSQEHASGLLLVKGQRLSKVGKELREAVNGGRKHK